MVCDPGGHRGAMVESQRPGMIVTVWAMNLVEMHETFAELDLEISHHPQNVRAERTPEREKINRDSGDGPATVA